MRCPKCSKEIPDDKLFCGFCGTRLIPDGETSQTPAEKQQDEPSPPAAASLAQAAPSAVDQDAVTRIEESSRQSGVVVGDQAPDPAEELVCTRCGRRNPADGRFCLQCGTALVQAGQSPQPAAAAPDKTAQEEPSGQKAPPKPAREKPPGARDKKKPEKKGRQQRRERKLLESRSIPAWAALLAGLAGMLGGFLGYYVQDPRYISDLGTWWTIYGLCSSLALFILLLVYGWVRWWFAAAAVLLTTLLWNGLHFFGRGQFGNFDWQLRSMLLEGALPGLLGLLLGAALFRGARRWTRTLLLGLLWLGSGWTGFLFLAYSSGASWFRNFPLFQRIFRPSLVVGYGLVSLLMAAALFWLLNGTLAEKDGREKPQPQTMWAAMGLAALGWFLAEGVVTAMFSSSRVHYLWPFAAMGFVGGLFTLLALRQYRKMDLKRAAAAVLLWVLLSMLRVELGVAWGSLLPMNLTWFLVSFAGFAMSAAGSAFLLDPGRPDWKLASWMALYWGSAVALSVSTANYLNDLSGVRMFFFVGGIRFDAWLWVTPLYMLAAMYFTINHLHNRPVSSDLLPEQSEKYE